MLGLPAEFIILDFETTDLSLWETGQTLEPPEIIEVGGFLVSKSLRILDTFQQLIRPQNMEGVTSFVTELTGITRNHLTSAPTWAEVREPFSKFTKYRATRLFTYGAAYDSLVLQGEYHRLKIPCPHKLPVFDLMTYIVCSFLSRGVVFSSHRLTDVAKTLGIAVTGAHRTLADCSLCLEILRKLDADPSTEDPFSIIEI